VSLHLPLTPETEDLIDRAALARMKSGAVLINTARGGLVEETALVEALTSGRLLAAGLDVVTEEPRRQTTRSCRWTTWCSRRTSRGLPERR
jgi:D-3-phosphoglycerate dehydrogenase / 2-oxoglutarate reductase